MGLFDRLRGDDHPRVAFVGIDGVPYSLIADNPDVFPNLTAIADAGSAGAIDSIVPPESSACWPSLTTGVNPGQTGVYGFQDREVGSYDTYVPMGRDVQATRIWDRVHNADRQATVFNVPVTFPPQRNVQRMMSGFLSPAVDKAATPDELRQYLSSIGFDDDHIDVTAKLGHKDDKSEFIENAYETIEMRHKLYQHYIEADDWDLFFGVFMTTDRVNHFLFRDYERDGEYKSDFLEFYAQIDEYIGKLRAALADDVTLLVASDHGFTSLDYEFHANEWLQREGWLEYESDEHEELNDISADSRAYSLIPGRFYLNLEGREPRGSVPESEYESVRDELKTTIQELEHEGEPVIERVVEREAVFSGDHVDIAPDLIAIPNHGYDLKAGFSGHENVFGTGPRNGMHNFNDACLFIDDPEANIDNVDLFDLTPTILELMELDYESSTFDGQSLL